MLLSVKRWPHECNTLDSALGIEVWVQKNINAYAVIATLVKVILLMLKAWLSVFLMKAANTFVTAVSVFW